MEQIHRIKEKISVLLNKENKWELFGSQGHKFRMNPPLTENEIIEFESRNGVQLPDDYKLFLQEVCNGGFGPYYGLHSLERSISEWDVNEEQPINAVDDNPFNDKYIVLSHEGCGYYFILVVSGKDKGSIWSYLRAADETMYPIKETFLEWYEKWVDYGLKVANEKEIV